MRGLLRLTAAGAALAAVSTLALAFGGCAALEGLSSITEQICAPDCDGGGGTNDATTMNEDSGQSSGDDAAMSNDATLGEDTSSGNGTHDAGEDSSSSTDAPSGADAADGSTPIPDAGHDSGPTVTCGGSACVANNATSPACSGSTCTYTCNTGYLDCNKGTSPDPDGCECNVALGATAAQCCSTQCPSAHDYNLDLNAAVGTFYDCVASGTYNVTVAMDACTAATGDAGACAAGFYCQFSDGGLAGHQVCSNSAATCDCWTYDGALVGLLATSTTNACYCPEPTGSPHWN